MNFKLTEKQEALKKEFEDFFREEMKNAPPEYGRGGIEGVYNTPEGFEFHKEMAKKLGAKGWISKTWPKDCGGQEAPMLEHLIFNEAKDRFRSPGIDIAGVGMFAPTLILAANDDQKERLLKPIARGEVTYCQGWSEPDAGSDLASLATTAIKDGDEYVVNGQKIWTTGAHRADCMFLLARTDPESKRSRGLSVFHLSMDLPGIEVRPIYYMDTKHVYNEVFLKDVRIPAKDLIGEENQGWKLTLETMNFERSSLGVFFVEGKACLEEMIEYVKTTKRNGKYLSQNPFVRQKIARLYTDLYAGHTLVFKIAWLQEQGGLRMAASAASEAKVFGTELLQKLADFSTEIMGFYGSLSESKWAPLGGGMVDAYQLAMGMTVAAGSSEVQRNIIAWTGLGLPRF